MDEFRFRLLFYHLLVSFFWIESHYSTPVCLNITFFRHAPQSDRPRGSNHPKLHISTDPLSYGPVVFPTTAA